MPRHIDRLTDAQRAQMPAWRDRWIKNGLSCAPMDSADRIAVERSVRSLYRRIKMAEPKAVLFVPSPFVLRVAAGIAGGAIHAIRNGWPDNRSAVRSALDSAVRSTVGPAVDFAVGSAVGSAVCSALGSAVGSTVRSAVDSAVRSAVGSAVCSALGSAVRSAVDSAVDSAVGSAVDSALDSAVDSALDSAVIFLLRCAESAGWNERGGNLWSSWPAWCSFFRDVCDLEIAEWGVFADLEITQTRCGPYALHPDFAMVSDRPDVLKRDTAGRLHAADGPSLAWRDSYALYFWHGVRVDAWLIEFPERITAASINAETNQELRRCMVEILGHERYLAQSDAQLMSSDDCGKLWRTRVGGEDWLIVEVANGSLDPDGSRRRYFLDVTCAEEQLGWPVRTARAAVAATYGLRPEQYDVAVRT